MDLTEINAEANLNPKADRFSLYLQSFS